MTATLEGGATLLTATEVTVSVGGGTAASGTDYAEVDAFTVTIPAETASGTGTFTLTPTNDTIAEGNESIDVTGTATDFTVSKATLILTDDEAAPTAITLSVSPASVGEDDAQTRVTVTATLEGGATLLTATEVTASVGGGTAASGTDYTAVDAFTVTIPAETASGTGTFTLTPTQDSIAEGDESIDVTGAATGFTVSKATLTLTDDEAAPTAITLSVSPASVSESASGPTVTVTATLDGSVTLPGATEVTVSVGGGTVTSGTDYGEVSNFAVTIGANESSGTGTFTLTPTNGSIVEGDETIDVNGAATGFTVTKAAMTLTDDDTAPTAITLSVSPTSVSEGDTQTEVTVTATLDGSVTLSSATEVAVSVGGGTATSGTDYGEVSNFAVTIGANESSGTGTFTLTPANDSIVEGDETIDVNGAASGFTVTKAEMNLTDDPADVPSVTASFEQATYTVDEGSSVTVTVELSEDPKRSVTVPLTAANQGGAGSSDYSGVPQSVTFASGETEKTFTFTAAADDVDDDGESVLLGFGTLPTAVSEGSPAQATVSIVDDPADVPSVTVSFGASDYSVDEGSSVTVTVELSQAPERQVVVPITTTGQAGAGPSDYSVAPTSVTFAPGDTEQTFTLAATADTDDDDNESVLLSFGTLPTGVAEGSPAQATVTITDVPSVTASFEQATYTVDEGSSVTVTVELSQAPERTVVVPITATGQAGAGSSDYSVAPTSVTFASGDTEKTLTFTATADTVDDDNESVLLSFGTLPTGVSEGSPAQATVSIVDDPADVPSVTVSFGASDYSVDEGATVTVTVELSEAPEREVVVPITAANQGGASGADYSGVPASVTFASGETTRTFTFAATDDDDGESVLLGFGTLPAGVSEGSPGEATVTITDDVPPVSVSFEQAAYTVDEGSSVTVTVELSQAPGGRWWWCPSPRPARTARARRTTAACPQV